MTVIKNTLESLLAEILRREKNSLEIISRLEEVFSSTNESVVLEYTLEDGSTETKEVESHGYMMQEFKRINASIESITGLDGLSSANIKLPDGSIKTIITSEVAVEPKPILSVGKPLYFHKRNNKPADMLLDPYPYMKFDLTGKVNSDTNQIMVKKVLLRLDTTQDIDVFNTEINGISLTYDDLITKLNDNGITSKEFDTVVPLPPKAPKFSGTFNVLNTFKRDVTTLVDQKEFTEKRIVYKLNSILYKDLENEESDVALKIGDELLVNDAKFRDTKYKIDTIDVSNNEITLKKIQGFRNITVGVNKLAINPSFINSFEIEVGININEYMVVFFKPLNPNLNVISTDWGEGIGLLTSELIDFDDKLVNTPFTEFYDNFVDDSGKNLSALTNENFIPLQDAIEPDAPVLNVNDFKVVKINTHREDTQSTEAIRKKFSEKNKTKKDIEKLDTSIEKQKTLIAVGDFKNDKERRNAQTTLDDLFTERGTKTTQLSTLVDDLVAKTKDVTKFTPKYRVRGFVEIPQPKYQDEEKKTGMQEVVQFQYQYRYLRKDNSSTEADSFKFTQRSPVPTTLTSAETSVDASNPVTTEEKKATFSRWNQISTVKKIKTIKEEEKIVPTSEDSNNVVKVKTVANAEENTNDPEVVNFNQLDIPISTNENVEIRVRAISEAGYPNKYSNWSDSIIVEFPEELASSEEFISSEAQEEQIKTKFLKELNAIGINEHLSNSIEIGGDIFDHSASRIATSFKTPENKPIDVNQVLIDQKAEIDALKAIISAEIAEMAVAITDEAGNELAKVSNNDTVNLFAGFYKDLVATEPVPKGEIVTKLYFIELSNVSDVLLELLSYSPGVVDDPLYVNDPTDPQYTQFPQNGNPYEGFLINKEEYTNYRKYWRVPISLRSITTNQAFNDHHDLHKTDFPFIQLPAFQSGQVKGQLLYSRERDISLNNKLYDGLNDAPSAQVHVPTQVGGSPETFVWNETATLTTPNGGGNATEFCVHVDHPDLDVSSDLMANFSGLFGASTKVPVSTIETTGDVNYPFFMHSKYFELKSSDPDGKLQLDYIYYSPIVAPNVGATVANFPKKIGFTKNDKYLIGKNTCGSYLFLAPQVHDSVHTGSQIYNVGKTVKKGDENVLRIPFIYQARMTDYHGTGSTGNGILGGFGSPAGLSNLSYSKKMGIDIQIKDQALFSFDIQVEMQFKARSISDVAARGGGFSQEFINP